MENIALNVRQGDKMVTINNDLVNETPVTLWCDDMVNPPVKIGIITNVLAFNDVRLQVAKEKSNNYYVVFNDTHIAINSYGRLHHWPAGMFDLYDNQLCELIQIAEVKQT